MSDKKLTILGVIACVMLVLAVVSQRAGHQQPALEKAPDYLIQGLNVDLIDTITLGTGENAVTIKRANKNSFVVANKKNYPAQSKQINDLINNCLDIKPGKETTRNPVNHTDLGVTEEKARNVIRFLDKEGKLITGLLVGNSAEGMPGTYVRLMNSDVVYLSERVPVLQTTAMNYIDKQLTKAERGDIIRVTATGPDGSYTIAPDPNQIPTLSPAPAEGKRAKATEVEQVFTVLTGLQFNDVTTKGEGLNFDHTFVCKIKDTTEYTLKLAQKGDKTFLIASASFADQSQVTIKQDGSESEEELKKKEAKLLARDAAKAFTERHKGWIYEVASWQADKLTKKLGDLVEDIPQEKPADANPAEEAEPVDSPAGGAVKQ